ncbi:MAG: sigma-54-dependent Fis family transcriptional regulator [Magnetococcales bacterium]|nr:sigma-54-dependent Fis family transcriptional regulator [Magnetococcales bacterium]MBF0114250.1 sigma-54-dependent Fis family transcriptional regulator [Magnetococcales bacterium]
MRNASEELLGRAPAFRDIVRAATLVAPTDATVLITGESGTGKELLARYIHATSRRARAPLVTINCAALPENLAESELFGHDRGAFSGAVQQQMGRVQLADKGTLFLDEIAEISPAIQAKLLRLLESGECQTVGQPRITQVDVRIISATNNNLRDKVACHAFRRDLFFRLNVVPLALPALRQRKEDIEEFLDRFTARFATNHRVAPPHYPPCVRQQLKNHSWPGNIRELRNFCERMVILHAGKRIELEHLPMEMQPPDPALWQTRQDGKSFILPEEGIDFDQLERHLIDQAIKQANGNRSWAARMLGLSYATFLYRLKKFSIPS